VSHSAGSANVAETPDEDTRSAAVDQVTTSPTGPATVSVASSRVGDILVGPGGRSLYYFQADKTSRSVCDGACAAAWPPLTTTGMPKAGPGAGGAQLGTTQRTDGRTQVTVDGHPVYFYESDRKKGDILGQLRNQFGGLWWVIDPSGEKITKSATASPSPYGGGQRQR
jgi:predicted lipoprotein with Yx(FWY)xxD motif